MKKTLLIAAAIMAMSASSVMAAPINQMTGNETAIQVKLNDLHHNLWRAKDALNTLDTRSAERRELLGEILRIAEQHDRAEKFIRRSAPVFQSDVSKRK